MPVPEAFYLWLISEVVGPQLADRAVGQLRSGWERRLAREAIAVSGVKVSRRRIEKWLKSEDVWNRLVRLQPADIAAMHRSLSAVVALSRGYRGASSQKVGESTQQMLDAVVGQFLALLEPSRALNVAHYREMWELKKLGRDVAEMRTILEDQTQRSDYLAVLPAPTARALERAAEVQPVPAAHLAAYLTQGTRSPAAIVHELWSEPPPWLTDGSHWLLLALAEFAASHGVNSTAAEIFEAMAEGGAPDRPRWLARAALSASGTGDQDRANRLAERARAFGGDSHSFVDFAAALISDDAESVMAAVTDELLEEKQDAAMALLAKARAEDLLGRRDDAIATLEGLTAERPDFTSALLTQARFLVNRAVTEGSDSRYADLTRAKDLSLAARNERRRWRGNSAEAAALAAEIAFNLGDLDEVLRIGLAGPDGDATGAETADPTLASVVALAAMAVGRTDVARRLASDIPSGPHKSLIQGWLLEADGDRDGARQRYHEAFDATEQPVDRRRVQTALAMLGEWPLPEWDELSAADPIQADELAALSEAARGLAEDAIVRLRRRAHESRQSAILLAEMLQESGDINSAVGVLEVARSRFDDPSLLVRAAFLLYRVDVPGARAMSKRALSEVPEGSTERITMHRLLIQCGADEGDWAEVEAQARALLAAGDSEPTTRWALIMALYNQGSLDGAWATLKRGAGLQPQDETQARLWIDLHRRFDASEETVVRILELVEIYKESEQLIAQALMAIYWMGDAVALSPETVSRLHGSTFDFTDRFPGSSMLTLVSAGSVEELVEQMRVRLAPGSAEFRELVEKVWLGQLPYGFLASFTGRPYSEALARRAAGCLPAHDASFAGVELDAARSAVGGRIAMTASALNVLWYIQESWPEVRASFASIATPRSTLLDAVAGREALALRSTMSLGWDPSSDSPVISEISDDQAEELFRRAAWIARECSTLEIVDGLRWERLPDLGEERTGPWLGPLELAFQRHLPLFSDDVAIRSLARSLGVNAFGTIALVTALVEAGRFTQPQADGFLLELARGFVVDLRLPESGLFVLAQRESWGLGAASFTLARPAFWRSPVEALGTAIAMHREASKNQPDAAPGWLFAASSGVARAIAPDVAAGAVGELLAAATTSVGLWHPAGFRANVEAVRAGLTSVHDGDPLPRALTVLCQLLNEALDSSAASRALMGLVSSLEGPDRHLALRIVLDGCRGEAR